jgi:hypothetical protein
VRIRPFEDHSCHTCTVSYLSCLALLQTISGITPRLLFGSATLGRSIEMGGFERAVQKFKEAFLSLGLTPADIPAAIVVHEILGMGIALAAWATCFSIQPSRTVARPLVQALAKQRQGAQLQQAYGAAMTAATRTVQRMSWLQKVNARTGCASIPYTRASHQQGSTLRCPIVGIATLFHRAEWPQTTCACN